MLHDSMKMSSEFSSDLSRSCFKEDPDTSFSQTSDDPEWAQYLATSSSTATPDVVFTHVETSLSSGIQPGQLLEIICERKLPAWYISDVSLCKSSCNLSKPDFQSGISTSEQCWSLAGKNKPDDGNDLESHETVTTYWIAKVASACGPLLSVQYVLPHIETSEHSWMMIGADTVAAVGHGEKQGYVPVPPLDVVSALSCSVVQDEKEAINNIGNCGSKYYQSVSKLMFFLSTCTNKHPWVADSALQKETLPSCKRLKPGGYVEVLACVSGKFGWPARIEQNVGGRLQLKFFKLDANSLLTTGIKSESSVVDEESKLKFTSSSSSEHMFWLFCTDLRLRNLGWIDKRVHDGYGYVCPLSRKCLTKLPDAFNFNFRARNVVLVPITLPISCGNEQTEKFSSKCENECNNTKIELATKKSPNCYIDETLNVPGNNASSIVRPTEKQKPGDAHERSYDLHSVYSGDHTITIGTDSAASSASNGAIICTNLQDFKEKVSNELIKQTPKNDGAFLLNETCSSVSELIIKENSDEIATDAVSSGTANSTLAGVGLDAINCSKSYDEKSEEKMDVPNTASSSSEAEDPDKQCLENNLSKTSTRSTDTSQVRPGTSSCGNDHYDEGKAKEKPPEKLVSEISSLDEKLDSSESKGLGKKERPNDSREDSDVCQPSLCQSSMNDNHADQESEIKFDSVLLISDLRRISPVENEETAGDHELMLVKRTNVSFDSSEESKVKRSKIGIHYDKATHTLKSLKDKKALLFEEQVNLNEPSDEREVGIHNILPTESSLERELKSEVTTTVTTCKSNEASSSKAEPSHGKIIDVNEHHIANYTHDGFDKQTMDFLDDNESCDKMSNENVRRAADKDKISKCADVLVCTKRMGSSAVDTLDPEKYNSYKKRDLGAKNVENRKILQHRLSTVIETDSMNVKDILQTSATVDPTATVDHPATEQFGITDNGSKVKNMMDICDEPLGEDKMKCVDKFNVKTSLENETDFRQICDIKRGANQFEINDIKVKECEANTGTDTNRKSLSTVTTSENAEKTFIALKNNLSCATFADKNEMRDLASATNHEHRQDKENSKNTLSNDDTNHSSLKAGMVLEVVNPEKLSCVHAAIISSVTCDGLVEVTFSSCEDAIKSELTCKVETKLEKEVAKIECYNMCNDKSMSCMVGSESKSINCDSSNAKECQLSTFDSHVINLKKYWSYFSDLVLLPTGFCDEFGVVLHPLLMDIKANKSSSECSNPDTQKIAVDIITTDKSTLSLGSSLPCILTCKSEVNSMNLNCKQSKTISAACEINHENFFFDSRKINQFLPIADVNSSQNSSALSGESLCKLENFENDRKKCSVTTTCVHNVQEIEKQKTPASEEKTESTECSSVLLGTCKKQNSEAIEILDASKHNDGLDFIDIDVEIVDDELQSNYSPSKEHSEVLSLPNDSSTDDLVDESSDAPVVEETDINEDFCSGNIESFCWTTFFKEFPACVRTPRSVFPEFPSAVEAGFSTGQKLEVVHPEIPETICAATVAATTGHLLWLKIDSLPIPTSGSVKIESKNEILSKSLIQHNAEIITSNPESAASKSKAHPARHVFCNCKKPNCIVIKPCSSDEIFPVGWAHCNNAKFLFPHPGMCDKASVTQSKMFNTSGAVFHDREKLSSANTVTLSDIPPEPNPTSESKTLMSETNMNEEPEPAVRSRWCPSVYLNHACCPGPHLSRIKLASQIGVAVEGPVGSVLGQIVSQSLAAGFCQARLCKDLTSALQHVADTRPLWQLIDVKAKSKRFSIRGSVMCPQFRDEVPVFLKRFFEVLQCCPNLWAFTKQPDCPHRCKKAVTNPVAPANVGRVKRSRLDSLLASTSLLADTNLDIDEDIEDEDDEWEAKNANVPGETGEKTNDTVADTGNEAAKASRKVRTDPVVVAASASEGTDAADQQPFKKRKLNRSYAIPPARVTSDPLSWSVDDVFDYVSNEATISHHATWLRNEKIDGKALMLLNLSTLVNQLQLPHVAVLPLAHHLCRLKMAHLLLRDGEC